MAELRVNPTRMELKRLRTRVKLTQSDVAKHLHVSKQTVYKWEQGLAPVTLVWDSTVCFNFFWVDTQEGHMINKCLTF